MGTQSTWGVLLCLNTKYKSPNMKLSAALVVLSSVARAQDYDLEDLLAGLNMEDLDLGFDLTPDLFTDRAAGENDAGEAAEAGVRYFGQAINTVTTTTTTTPTTVTTNGQGCFKCDQMSMAECAALGQFEVCPSGESSMCFIEIREVNQQVNQLCTGCKNTQACHELQQQNFLGGPYHMDQCRRHYIEQTPRIRSPNGQSTCRQCFKQCETSASGTADGMCFFGHDADFADEAVNTLASGATDATGNTGKDHPSTAEMAALSAGTAREQRQMAYWGIVGASRNWWASDLVAIQNQVAASAATDKTTLIAVV